ncbi:hypothetical protein B0H13DRAFT_1859238 [Mycena leptocephala]|nr:hypothetical protein B0H13DRAFT_1859238 [Mycena leptocephala]
MVLAGPTDIIAFLMGFLWLELHLLTFEVLMPSRSSPMSLQIMCIQIKNQMADNRLEEDRLSKPNRPIVSGRLSVAMAQKLYVVVGALSFAAVYLIAIYCYNEIGMSRHWFLKSFLGPSATFAIAGHHDHGKALSNISITAIATSGLLHTTTGHAQDFRDRPGDAAIGRKTLPLLLPPRLARWSLAALLATWTFLLIRLWAPPHAVSLLLALLALTAATKFIRDHSVEADRDSYWYYNMWLITAHLLPVFARFAARRLCILLHFLL